MSQTTLFPRIKVPFRPFPRLWAAFAGEPDIIKILDDAYSFAFLDDAGRLHATRGVDAARSFITAGRA